MFGRKSEVACSDFGLCTHGVETRFIELAIDEKRDHVDQLIAELGYRIKGMRGALVDVHFGLRARPVPNTT